MYLGLEEIWKDLEQMHKGPAGEGEQCWTWAGAGAGPPHVEPSFVGSVAAEEFRAQGVQGDGKSLDAGAPSWLSRLSG